jgi:diguanylate cyclase (GGDEF)-like protein
MQTILVVDDDKSIHWLLAVQLMDQQVELRSVYTGDDGLKAAIAAPPDLILLDIDLPDLDGFEVCRRLKSNPATNRIPVLFLTGYCSPERKISGLNLGAVDYITKPFDPAELTARIGASLRTKRLVDLLEHKALVDGLTELWNRAYFDHRLHQEETRTSRQPLVNSCIMLDIDHFKSINDRFGHPFGDLVLRGVGAVLVAGCRNEDSACRYGGDEFAILLPGVDATAAAVLAERLRSTIANLDFVCQGEAVKVMCSFGVADTDGTDIDSLTARADAALYEAKRQGRNRVHPAAPEPALQASSTAGTY